MTKTARREGLQINFVQMNYLNHYHHHVLLQELFVRESGKLGSRPVNVKAQLSQIKEDDAAAKK